MKICNCSAKLAFLALIAAGLLAVPPEKSQAQEPENFAWITNKNGITWKREIYSNSVRKVDTGHSSGYSGWWSPAKGDILYFDPSDKPKIASILVPEHAIINAIDGNGCLNLTNLVIQPARSGYYALAHVRGEDIPHYFWEKPLVINAENSGLSNITCSKAMRNSIRLTRGEAEWWPIQWTELELPKIEIRTHATGNGQEVEVVWKEGTLQIADAVNGEWRDHIGASPLRFPLVVNSKDKQFFRIRRSESPITEEPPTPQTLGGNR